MTEEGLSTAERVLEEVTLELNPNRWKVEMMRRNTSEEKKTDKYGSYVVATVRVHVVISDRAIRVIGEFAFQKSVNLWKITAPFVEEVGENAFWRSKNLVEVVLPNVNIVECVAFDFCYTLRKVALPSARSIGKAAFNDCYDLRHITLHPDVEVDKGAFFRCLSLEVLAASANFEIDTGDKTPGGYNDPTRGITRYLKWRNSMDYRCESFHRTIVLLKLASPPPPDSTIPPRATTSDPIMEFLAEKGCGEKGFAHHLLSFCPQFCGEKRGKGDLRGATKAELLAVGLELKVLRKENNRGHGGHHLEDDGSNDQYWGLKVDENGEVTTVDYYYYAEEESGGDY